MKTLLLFSAVLCVSASARGAIRLCGVELDTDKNFTAMGEDPEREALFRHMLPGLTHYLREEGGTLVLIGEQTGPREEELKNARKADFVSGARSTLAQTRQALRDMEIVESGSDGFDGPGAPKMEIWLAYRGPDAEAETSDATFFAYAKPPCMLGIRVHSSTAGLAQVRARAREVVKEIERAFGDRLFRLAGPKTPKPAPRKTP